MASPMTRNKELPPRHHWIVFSSVQIELNLSRNQNLCLNIRHEAACTPCPVADDPSALPSPTFSPPSRQQLCFSLHWMPAPVGQLLYFTTVFFKVLHCKIKNVLFLVCFLCIICVESTYTLLLMCVCVHACAQLCLTLCDPMNCSPPGFSVHGILQAKNIGVGCHSLLHGIFPTQGSNPGLLVSCIAGGLLQS